MLLPGIRVVTRAGRAARSRELLTNSDFDTGVCGAWFSSVDSNNRVSGFWSGLALVAARGLLALPGPTLFSLPRACSPARRAWWGSTCARPRGGSCRSGTRCPPPDWPPPRLFGRGRPSRLAALCFLGVRSLRLLSHLALGSGGGGCDGARVLCQTEAACSAPPPPPASSLPSADMYAEVDVYVDVEMDVDHAHEAARLEEEAAGIRHAVRNGKRVCRR